MPWLFRWGTNKISVSRHAARVVGPAVMLMAVALVEVVSRAGIEFAMLEAVVLLALIFATFAGGLISGLISAAVGILYAIWSPAAPLWVPADIPHGLAVAELGLVALLMTLMVATLRRRMLRNERVMAAREEAEALAHRFEKLVQGLDAIVWEGSGEPFQFTFVSERAEQMLGYPAQRWLGPLDFWISLIHPDDREHAVKGCMVALEESRGGTLEYRMIAADGRHVWIRELIQISPADRRGHQKVCGLMIDITPQRQAEAALRHSEHRFRVAQELSLDAFCIFSSVRDEQEQIVDFRWEYANPAAGRMLGLASQELIGRRLLDMRPAPATQADLFERYIHVVNTAEPYSVDFYYDTGGFRGWVRNMVVKSNDGLAISFSDITERKRNEQELRESEQHLRKVLDSVAFFTGVLTPAGLVLAANQAVLNAANLTLQDVLNKPVEETYWWSYSPRLQEQLRQAVEQAARGITSRFDAMLRFGANEYRLVDFTLAPMFDEEGRVTHLIPSGNDVTERKRTEEALRSSEQRYRALFNSASDPSIVYELTKQGEPDRIVEVNEAAVRLLGYERDALLRMTVDQLVPPEVRKSEQWLATLREHGSVLEESVVVTHDGQRVPIETHAHLFDLNGKPTVLAIGRNISARKESETALAIEHAAVELERSRLKAMLDILPVGVLIVDAQGRIVDSNMEMRAIWGEALPVQIDAEQLRQHEVRWADTGEPIAIEDWGLYRALRHGEVLRDQEIEMLCVDKQRKTLLNHVLPIRDGGDQIMGAVTVNVDITRRKLAEHQLLARIREHEAIAQMGHVALTCEDPQELMNKTVNLVSQTVGNEMCTVLELDPGREHLRFRAGVGWRPKVVGVARVPADLSSQAGYTLQADEPVILTDLRTEHRFTGPLLLREHNVVSGMSVVIPGEGGKPWGVLTTHTTRHHVFTRNDANFLEAIAHLLGAAIQRRDTEQKLMTLNETLEQRVAERTAMAEHRARQLQALAAEVTQAEQRERRRLAQMLHDHLQQLLVAARMRTALLPGRLHDDDARHAVKQIDEMLSQAIEASRSLTVELSPSILYDAGLVAALEWLARHQHEKYGLTVYVDADPDAEPRSEQIRVLLFQAVQELLFNVVKHSQGKEAWVRLTRDPDDLVQIMVKDIGVGFTADATEHQDREEGFGLFSIRERLQLFGGTFHIQSAPGEGTCITLRAPADTPGAPGSADLPSTPKSQASGGTQPRTKRRLGGGGKNIRVLLADDHKILREGIAGLLEEQADIEIVGEASDGQMAVDMARELQPDVVVMDVTMPRLNGVEATRRITREVPDVAVIGLSIHEEEDMANAMREAGAAAYRSKGGPSDALVEAIRNCRAARDSAPQR